MKKINYINLLAMTVLTVWMTGFVFSQHIAKGYVYDVDTYEPLAKVQIQSTSSEMGTSTNEKGYFELEVTQPNGTINFSLKGYDNQQSEYKIEEDLFVMLSSQSERLLEVQVNAYNSNQSVRETAGAISTLKAKDLQQGSGMSMQAALNSVPGVRMDQSTLSDARISIRGNGVRSPWGIRDVKIYVNDIPLTEADGTSRIEGLDIHDLGNAEILRGPAASIYGGGVAGVINFNMNKTDYREHSAEVNGLYGSFGLARVAGIYRFSNKSFNSYVSYGQQWYDGYRDHSKDSRNFITGNFQFFPSVKRKITLLVNRTGQKSQIPGALTETEILANRRQASATNLDKNAGRDEIWTRIGIGQKYKFNDKLSNSSSIYTYFYDLDHPLPYAIQHSMYQSYGGRTLFDYQPKFRILDTKFTVGGELNYAVAHGDRFVNNHGEEGNIMSSNKKQYLVYSAFLQTYTQFAKNTFLTLGVNFSGITYHIKDYLNDYKSGIKRFKPQASPRIALSQNIAKWMSIHGSVSLGYSPPTSSEIANVDGSVNQSLQAQNAINYEIDVKGELFNSRMSYDLAVFMQDMRGELIAKTPTQGVTIYENAGRTSHNGVELGLVYQPLMESDDKWITNLTLQTAVTYSHFRFKDYKIRDSSNAVIKSFDGNQLTGIAPWTVSAGLNIETKTGLYLSANFYYNDRLPLNDANTDFNKDWSTLNVKIGYTQKFWNKFVVDVYVGSENLTNTKYSSYVALNAVGYGGNLPAYYNPSPERSFYGGVSLKYIFQQ